jgi:hypothetical protein
MTPLADVFGTVAAAGRAFAAQVRAGAGAKAR